MILYQLFRLLQYTAHYLLRGDACRSSCILYAAECLRFFHACSLMRPFRIIDVDAIDELAVIRLRDLLRINEGIALVSFVCYL